MPQGTTFQVLNSEAGVQERSGLVTPLDHSITQLNGQPEPSCGHGCLEFTTFFSILLDFQDNRCWYVNLYSDPDTASLPDLAGGVFWHTQHWVGAVLATAQLETDKSHQIKTFLNSAIAIGRTLLL
ncbi:MAG: hypothetical protein HC769_13430 [Cyanobacteria bacterium CRU_2_1]|nr:hypothetical protein [Cyanobacteria bacterium CRU_2_1]